MREKRYSFEKILTVSSANRKRKLRSFEILLTHCKCNINSSTFVGRYSSQTKKLSSIFTHRTITLLCSKTSLKISARYSQLVHMMSWQTLPNIALSRFLNLLLSPTCHIWFGGWRSFFRTHDCLILIEISRLMSTTNGQARIRVSVNAELIVHGNKILLRSARISWQCNE